MMKALSLIAATAVLVAAHASDYTPHEARVQHGPNGANAGFAIDAQGMTRKLSPSGVSNRKKSRRLAPGGAVVNLDGLEQPTCFIWDPSGRYLYVGEKRGTVKRFTVPDNGNGDWVHTFTDDDIVLDLRGRISSFGDHGMDTIIIDGPYLYATYMKLNPDNPYGNDCPDSGQMDGRPRDQVNGCPIYGRMSRWAFDAADGTIAPVDNEDVVLDTQTLNAQGSPLACVQFSTHSTPSGMAKNPDDGYIYVTLGDGAGFASVDPGDLGQNPCHDQDGMSGAFRSQDPNRWVGKSLRVNPVTKEATMWTLGHRNPFRLTFYQGDLYATETGWYTYEEINKLERGNNYGWPCYEGPSLAPEYRNFQRAVCDQLAAAGGTAMPFHYYDHPQTLGTMVSSVSAVAGWTNRIFFGDYAAQYIKSVAVDETDPHAEAAVHMRDVYPVDLKVTPANVLVYVDFTRGQVKPVVYDGPVASASPAPPPPVATIKAHTPVWTPGAGTLYFTSTDTVFGREGAVYTWNITALSSCQGTGATQTCEASSVFEVVKGQTYSFPSPALTTPPSGATLHVNLKVNSYAGFTAVADTYLPGPGVSTPCQCLGGVRRWVDLPTPPPVTGTVTASEVTTAPSTVDGGIAATDGTGQYGPMILQPVGNSPWVPGIGNITINILSTLPKTSGNLIAYTCTVSALFGCSSDGRTCGSAAVDGVQGTVRVGRQPVLTFPAPVLPASAAAGATLEITCTATTTYTTMPQTAGDQAAVLTQRAMIRIPSTGSAVCPCSGTRTAVPSPFPGPTVDLKDVHGMASALPLGLSVVVPDQSTWENVPSANPAPMRFTCASSLVAQAAEAGGDLNITWSMNLLRDCSANRTVARVASLYAGVVSSEPTWSVPVPRVTGGGTLEVNCRVTVSDIPRIESATAYIPYEGQAVCLGTDGRTPMSASSLPMYTPTTGTLPPWTVTDTSHGQPTVAHVTSSVASWTPASPGTLGQQLLFTASSAIDGVKDVSYDWIVTLACDCSGPDCGWAYITSINNGKKQLVITAPDVPEGGTLEVTVIARTNSTPPAAGVTRVAAVDQAICQCTGSRYPKAIVPMPGSEGNYSVVADMYRYGGVASTRDPPSAKPTVDANNPGFIAGVTLGSIIIAGALAGAIVGAGWSYGRKKAMKDRAANAGSASTRATDGAASNGATSNALDRGKTASSEGQATGETTAQGPTGTDGGNAEAAWTAATAAGAGVGLAIRMPAGRPAEPAVTATGTGTDRRGSNGSQHPGTATAESDRHTPGAPILHHDGEPLDHDKFRAMHVHMPADRTLPHNHENDPEERAHSSRKVTLRHPTPPPGAHRHKPEEIAAANAIAATTMGTSTPSVPKDKNGSDHNMKKEGAEGMVRQASFKVPDDDEDKDGIAASAGGGMESAKPQTTSQYPVTLNNTVPVSRRSSAADSGSRRPSVSTSDGVGSNGPVGAGTGLGSSHGRMHSHGSGSNGSHSHKESGSSRKLSASMEPGIESLAGAAPMDRSMDRPRGERVGREAGGPERRHRSSMDTTDRPALPLSSTTPGGLSGSSGPGAMPMPRDRDRDRDRDLRAAVGPDGGAQAMGIGLASPGSAGGSGLSSSMTSPGGRSMASLGGEPKKSSLKSPGASALKSPGSKRRSM